jgi:hypothetical protein
MESGKKFGYECNLKAPNEPELYPQEEVYLRVPKATL